MPNLKDKPAQSSPIPSNYLIMLVDPVTGAVKRIQVSELLNANFVPDTTPPTIVSASVLNATTIRLLCSEVIPVGAATGWSAKKAGANNPIVSMTGFGTATLDITVANAMVAGDAIRVSYNPGAGNSLDAAGNEFATITDFVVTNGLSGGGGGDTTAPTIVSKNTPNANPDTIVVVFSEAMGSVTTAGWSARKALSNWPISSVSGSGTTWTFTMSTAAASGEALDISYNPSTGDTKDAANNELGSYTNSTVTNDIAGLVALNYSPATGLTNSSGNWTGSVFVGGGWEGSFGLGDRKLPSNGEGSYEVEIDNADSEPFIGIQDAAVNNKYNGTDPWNLGILKSGSNIYVWTGGGLSGIITTATGKNKFRIRRTLNTTLKWYLDTSTNGGVSWSQEYEFADTLTGEAFLTGATKDGTANKIRQPKVSGSVAV